MVIYSVELEIFHYFQYFEGFRSMKKWQISKPKIVHWYQVKERHLFFQNLFFKTMGNLAGPLYMSPVDWAGPALTWLIYMRNFSPVSEMRKSQRSWERVLAPNLRNKANMAKHKSFDFRAYHSFDKIFSPLTEISVEKTEISGTEPARPLT